MILVVDNYDSFTYTLAQYVTELGERVEVRRNDAMTVPEVLRAGYRGVLISPGPGVPSRAGICPALVPAVAACLPVLGVCLGHQAIAEAFGGRIVPARTLVHGKTSAIHHDGRTLFRGLPNPFPATRYHSLVVDHRSLPEALEASAWTADGMLMGLRHRELRLEGVQFHPESVLTTAGMSLLRNWVETIGRPATVSGGRGD